MSHLSGSVFQARLLHNQDGVVPIPHHTNVSGKLSATCFQRRTFLHRHHQHYSKRGDIDRGEPTQPGGREIHRRIRRIRAATAVRSPFERTPRQGKTIYKGPQIQAQSSTIMTTVYSKIIKPVKATGIQLVYMGPPISNALYYTVYEGTYNVKRIPEGYKAYTSTYLDYASTSTMCVSDMYGEPRTAKKGTR